MDLSVVLARELAAPWRSASSVVRRLQGRAMTRGEARDVAVAWFLYYRGEPRRDHWPVRTCLGCGAYGSGPSLVCSPRGAEVGEFRFTWTELGNADAPARMGQTTLF